MVVNILRSISANIGKIGQENSQFKQVAAQQNGTISKFVKDISRMFASQSKQQNDMNNSLNNLEQGNVMAGQKMDQTNSLLQESISIQSQMYNEIRSVSSSLSKLLDLAVANQNGNGGNGGIGAATAGLIGGAALGAGILGASQYLQGGAGSLTNMLGGGKPGFQNTSGEGRLSVPEMVKLAKEAGFTDQEATIMGAIGAAESSGNPMAHNPVGRDNSYGLWQINMLGQMGAERRNQFGISSNEQLLDPKTNAAAARKVFEEQGFEAWSVYGSGAYLPYLGTATQSLSEKDSPPGMVASSSDVLGNYSKSSAGVYENQQSLAGIRKMPLSEKLRGVLNQASAAAGVEAVVYSGGQPAKGSGGQRTGSTRHDNGNAADLYLMKGGRKLVDTNPEDRAIMAKFVSAAVAAGATGVGAGHNYMGPSNIHVGFGKQAVWGGAPWIRSAATGVYSNQDLSSEGGQGYAGGGGGVTGIESVDNALSGLTQSLAGTPFAGLSGGLTGAMAYMAGGSGIIPGIMTMGAPGALIGGAMGIAPVVDNMLKTTGTTNLFENIFRPAGSEMDKGTGPNTPNRADKDEVERFGYSNEDHPEGDDLSYLLKNLNKEPQAINSIQNAALESEISRMNANRSTYEPVQTNNSQPEPNLTQNAQAPQVYSSSASWYLQLAGRISNDETMKFKGGVFA